MVLQTWPQLVGRLISPSSAEHQFGLRCVRWVVVVRLVGRSRSQSMHGTMRPSQIVMNPFFIDLFHIEVHDATRPYTLRPYSTWNCGNEDVQCQRQAVWEQGDLTTAGAPWAAATARDNLSHPAPQEQHRLAIHQYEEEAQSDGQYTAIQLCTNMERPKEDGRC